MKLSLLTLILLPTAYAAPAQLQSNAEQNQTIVDVIGKMTNNLLLDTDKFAEMNGMLLEDMVTVPGVTVKSNNPNRMERRGWRDYLPLVKSLTKNVLSEVGGVLEITAYGEVADIVRVVEGFL